MPRSRYTRGRIRRVHPNGRINYHGEPPTSADGVEPAALAAMAAEIAQEAAAAELTAAEAAVDAGAAVVSFLAAVLTRIYQGNVSSCQEILRRNGRGQPEQPINLAELSLVAPAWEALPLGCAPPAQLPRLLWWAICELACAGNR